MDSKEGQDLHLDADLKLNLEETNHPLKDIFEGVPPMYLKQLEIADYQMTVVTGDEVIASTKFDEAHFLGKGRTTIVLKLDDSDENNTGRIVKVYFPNDSSINYKQHLENEKDIHEKVHHPHLAELFAVGKVKINKLSVPCLVKEDLPFSLEDRIVSSEDPIPFTESINMIHDIASVVQTIYDETGDIITDLTPENIRRSSAGVWKLSEPGSTAHKDKDSVPDSDDVYSAPECKGDDANETATPASMVYTLGVICYELFTHKKIIDDDITFRANKNPFTQENLDPLIYTVLEKALNDDPNKRYATPNDFSDALEAAVSGEYSI